MNRKEILQQCIWETAKMKVHSPFFGKEVEVWLTAHYKALRFIEEDIISPTMVATVNDFLQMSQEDLPLVQRLIYQHCLDCCADTSYGFEVQEGETETQANLREFGVKNEQDAFTQANLSKVYIEDDALEKRKHRYVRLSFYPPWEQEHGLELILQNGKLLDYCGEGGTWLTQFE